MAVISELGYDQPGRGRETQRAREVRKRNGKAREDGVSKLQKETERKRERQRDRNRKRKQKERAEREQRESRERETERRKRTRGRRAGRERGELVLIAASG